MTSLQTLTLRRALADKLPNYPNVDSGGNISLRRGIFQAVEVHVFILHAFTQFIFQWWNVLFNVRRQGMLAPKQMRVWSIVASLLFSTSYAIKTSCIHSFSISVKECIFDASLLSNEMKTNRVCYIWFRLLAWYKLNNKCISLNVLMYSNKKARVRSL